MQKQLKEQFRELGDATGHQAPGERTVVEELPQHRMGGRGVDHRSRLVMKSAKASRGIAFSAQG